MEKKNLESKPPENLRRRAEEFLSERPETLETMSTADIRRLVHELEVHQIELEMQNEELRRAQNELEELHSKYYDLYDFAPIGYFTLNNHSIILEANLTGANLLGIERRRLSKQPFSRFVSPESQDQFYFHRNKAFETKSLETCELKLLRIDSTVFHANLGTIAVPDEEGVFSQLLSAVTDITERKQVENALRVSEEKFRDLYDKAPNAYFSIDAHNGAILNCNKAALRMLGYSRNTLLRMKVFELYTDSAKGLREAKKNFKRLKAGESIRDVELQMKHQKGELIWISLSVEPVRDLHGKIIESRSMVIDISERKHAEEALRNAHDELEMRVEERTAELSKANALLQQEVSERKQVEEALRESEEELHTLSSKLLVAQEEERKKVALELHDVIGQSLSAIKYRVETAQREMEEENASRGIVSLAPIVPMVQGAVEEVRRIQKDLRPSILDDLGILATVSWFCREYESTYPAIKIENQIDIQENDVPDPLKIVIYRIFQEALNNIAKHSHAHLIWFSLKHSDGTIHLSIRDDGVGFDTEEALSEDASIRGLGLSGMRERTQFSGGTFRIASRKGSGTAVLASWPTSEQSP
jgi:PAS domain S-box-containing protein